MTAMQYQGRGRFLVGVPARDLTSDEVARLPERIRARLTASGVYRPVVSPIRAAKPTTEVKPNV